MQKKEVTIIGDTSSFHLGSQLNYTQFRKLVDQRYNIIQEIPYDAFGIAFIDYPLFLAKLKESIWWKGIEHSDILVVHGEGLTEKWADYVYPYLYFAKIANEQGIESWLVNFSMYEVEPFLDLIKQFNYIATRDMLTHTNLKAFHVEAVLSFDCCVLAMDIADYTNTNDHVAAIKGRRDIGSNILSKFNKVKKYNCCWQWPDKENVVNHASVFEYVKDLKKASFCLSSSFHGNIISYLSGIPFYSVDKGNPKCRSLSIELLPKGVSDTIDGLNKHKTRLRVYEHYFNIFDNLVTRSMLNVL